MRTLARLAALLASIAALSCSQNAERTGSSPCARPPDKVVRLHNIHYGSAPLELLDLFLPKSRAGEPLLLLIHGGGWSGGDKASYGLIARHVSGCGIAVANMDYPLGPTIHSGRQAASALAALRWLEARAAVYGYAIDRTTVAGHSAGAQIAALAMLDPSLVRSRRGIQVSGVIAISGLGYAPPQASSLSALPDYLVRFYRAAFGPDPSRWQRFDLTRFVHPGPPAFLIIHARDDSVAPEGDSAAFFAALHRAGAVVEYLQPQDRDHNSVLADVPMVRDDPTGLAIERFILSR